MVESDGIEIGELGSNRLALGERTDLLDNGFT
jgi:hypothetical protein